MVKPGYRPQKSNFPVIFLSSRKMQCGQEIPTYVPKYPKPIPGRNLPIEY